MVMFHYSIHQMQKESLSLLVNPDPQFLPTSWGMLDERLLSHKISSFMLCNTKETSYWTRTNFYSPRPIVRTNYGIEHNMIRTPFFVVSSLIFGDHNQLGPFSYMVFAPHIPADRDDISFIRGTLFLTSVRHWRSFEWMVQRIVQDYWKFSLGHLSWKISR